MAPQTEPFDVAAYGGEGWSPRTQSLAEELGHVWGPCGASSEWAKLKAVLLHRPGEELAVSSNPNEALMLEPVSWERARSQHDGIAQAYRDAGVIVHYVDEGTPAGLSLSKSPSPNQMFIADLLFMTPEGAILARPASTVRAGEERWVARRLADLGIPIISSVRGKGTFEGADALWINPESVILGCGLRTNNEGATQVTRTLNEMGVDVIQVDLPFGTMHLMGMLRIVGRNLALARPKRLAHRGVQALQSRGIRVEFVPDGWETDQNTALNFVPLGPRQILMAAGNPNTQGFYESQGIECRTVPVDELAKAAGGIGCLTGVLERESPP